MTEHALGHGGEPIQAKARRARRIPLVWLIPIVAGAIALWLGYRTISEQGPTITLTFKTGEGLEAGKTRVKHKDVELGVVKTVELHPDLSHVVITANMSNGATPHLNNNARFWVVRPRLGVGGVSGLGTLVSGAYIELDPGIGEAAAARSFVGLEEPPVIRSEISGRKYELHASRLGGISAGSPVFFRGIKVGEVAAYDDSRMETEVVVSVFVRSPYDRYVHDRTRFWNASGIALSTGGGGVKVQLESLEALLAGGIAFDTLSMARAGEPSKEGTVFPLYDNAESAQDASFTRRQPYLVNFEGSVRGLAVGSPVEVRGLKVGRVADVRLAFDPASKDVRVPVVIEIERERFVAPGDEMRTDGQAIMRELVRRGLRAQLRSGNLITGELVVSLDFFPDAPPMEASETDGLLKIPAVPTDLDNITRSVTQVLDRLASLPLDKVVGDLGATVAELKDVAQSPEIRGTLKALSGTLSAGERLAKNAETQIGPLLSSLRQVAGTAQSALKRADTTFASADESFGRDSQVRRDMVDLLNEVTDMVRSIRLLVEYIEQRPEVLLRGKSEKGRE